VLHLREKFELAQARLSLPGPSQREIWYRTKRTNLRDVEKSLESAIIHKFNGSLSKALLEIFPDHHWHPWRFTRVPPNYWDDRQNRLAFIEYVATFHNIVHWPEDWYNISLESVRDLGGQKLLALFYQDSMLNALVDLYPQYEWEPWRFSKVPSNFWQDIENQKLFWISLGKKKGFSKMESWYAITPDDVLKHGGITILKNYHRNSLAAALTAAFPEHNWDPWKFLS
jgi:hypothetical protein